MKNVLVFPSGTEIAREVVDSLKDNKNYNLIGGASIKGKSDYLPYSFCINDFPFISAESFLPYLNSVIDKYKIDYIFPCHDDVSLILAKNNVPCKVVTHNFAVNNYCRDKEKTYELLQDAEYCPKLKSQDSFPLFAKPKRGNGSVGAKLIESKAQLDCYLEYHKIEDTLLVEYLPGKEFTVDCFSKNNKLLISKARERNTSKMGIAEISTSLHDTLIDEIALDINNRFNKLGGFNGAWFFQLKLDKDKKYKLLEIGPRISGGMSLSRMAGFLNFSEASIEAIDNPISLPKHSTIKDISFTKFFLPTFKYTKIQYTTLYVDFDDTLYNHKTKSINTDLVKLIFQCVNEKKDVALLTRSKIDFRSILRSNKLYQVFDEIIHLDDFAIKADYISPMSVLVDDSFRERNFKKEGVYCFGVDNFKVLLND